MCGCRWNSLRDQTAALTHRDDRPIPRAIHERSPIRHVSNPAPGLTAVPNRGTCRRRSARRTITCARDRSDCAHPSGGGATSANVRIPAGPVHDDAGELPIGRASGDRCAVREFSGLPTIANPFDDPCVVRQLRGKCRIPAEVTRAMIYSMAQRVDRFPVHDDEIRAQFAI